MAFVLRSVARRSVLPSARALRLASTDAPAAASAPPPPAAAAAATAAAATAPTPSEDIGRRLILRPIRSHDIKAPRSLGLSSGFGSSSSDNEDGVLDEAVDAFQAEVDFKRFLDRNASLFPKFDGASQSNGSDKRAITLAEKAKFPRAFEVLQTGTAEGVARVLEIYRRNMQYPANPADATQEKLAEAAKKVQEAYEQLKKPSISSARVILNAYFLASKRDEALEFATAAVKDAALSAADKEDVYHTALIGALSENAVGTGSFALKVLQSMNSNGVPPSAKSFSLIMRVCVNDKSSGVNEALKVYREMKFCGIKGNAQVFDILAEIVETLGNTEDQRRLAKSVQAEIREVDEELFQTEFSNRLAPYLAPSKAKAESA